jgi:hypothetical protein
MRDKFFFFEPESGGHQWYFIRHLLSALVEEDWDFAAAFVLHPELACRAEAFVGGTKSPTPVQVIALTPAEQTAAVSRPLWRSAAPGYLCARHHEPPP